MNEASNYFLLCLFESIVFRRPSLLVDWYLNIMGRSSVSHILLTTMDGWSGLFKNYNNDC